MKTLPENQSRKKNDIVHIADLNPSFCRSNFTEVYSWMSKI